MSRRSVFYPKGKGRSIKVITALISLLFLVAIAAMPPALPLDSGSSGYAVTEASPSLAGKWIEKANTNKSGALGEAVVGAGDYIYIAWCRSSTKQPEFWRYDPIEDKWNYSMSNSSLPRGAFRNGAALAWDGDNYIYALSGGRYEDLDRYSFYRYEISEDRWEQLNDTLHPQGAGDAIAWSGYDRYIYAITGDRGGKKKSAFAQYNCNNDEWNALPFNWTSTDDGASLIWTGGKYLYALRGEVGERKPHTPITNFSRYSITNRTWEDMCPIPESEGIGDGGSLLWIGNWLSEYSDYIFALSGGSGVKGEDPGYNFYSYNISSNNWEPLEAIPCPIGYYVGNRLGFANGHIYYWQGSPKNESKWICNGTAFRMFEFEAVANFDTGPGTYPSIFGTHNGTITPNQTLTVSTLYTYPCKGTGGHTEYIKIGNATWNATATWKGYKSDWHNVTFDKTVVLRANETYDYTIHTGSNPQIHHTPALPTASGWINCAEFVDANGKRYNNWIPAIRLE